MLSVPFLGHNQTVQTQIRCPNQGLHCLLTEISSENEKSTPDTAKFGTGVVQLTRIEMSTGQKRVNFIYIHISGGSAYARPGAVARSDARPPGMQTVAGSIPRTDNILSWRWS